MTVATNTLKPQLLVLKKGEYVFEEGDEAIFAYVLTEGTIEIVAIIKGEELVLGKVEKGTIFGEMAIIDGFPRSASARAATACKVQEVGHKEFLNYISKKPDAAFQIMGRLSGFVRSADKKASESFLLRKTGVSEEEEDGNNDKTDIVAVHNFEDTESIYARPPAKPVIVTAVSLILFMLVMTLWASFSFVDKTVSARGKFTNTAPNIEIQSTGSSIIEELNLERGQFITKGETVAKLDGTVVNANLKITRDKIYAVKNKILRLELQKISILQKSLNEESLVELDSINKEILNRHFDEFMITMKTFSSDLLRLETEIVSMSADKDLIRDQLDIKIKIEDGKKKLFEKNVGSLMDTLSSTDQRISVNRQLLSTTGSIKKLKSEKTALDDQRSSYLTGELAGIAVELSSFNDQLLQLNEELIKNELERSNLFIKSPVEGVVLNLPTITIGSLINKGEPIVTLVRAGLPLVLEIDVDPKDASDLYNGNPVSVKIDALPFQQFGDLAGTLVYISDDTVEESLQGESGAFYRGRVHVKDSEIMGLPEEFDLTPGMLATADLKVGKRRLITYFTNPILKSLSSAMREPD
ncbi:MAG: HlyD family type I secretion periplasmic adaptor subunit [SAR324 cluster bacterium]|nr:HlyD family type I secretion periplasmic adaptor subunit [SAR324 cluster bacterium]MBL7034989.1 HlyD family type I secretion periplasmic adaptor subunit [SAR324 cluster bacterium]